MPNFEIFHFINTVLCMLSIAKKLKILIIDLRKIQAVSGYDISNHSYTERSSSKPTTWTVALKCILYLLVFHRTFSSEIEYTFPVLLSLILTLKYIFFDEATDKKTSVDSSSLVKQDEEHKKLECRILEELNQESPANKTCIQSSRELLQSHDKIAEGNICPGKTDTSSSSSM